MLREIRRGAHVVDNALGAADRMGHKRRAHEVIRKLIRRRGSRRARPKVIKQGRIDTPLMTAFHPSRTQKGVWKNSWTRTETMKIDLQNFSFLDAPIQTINLLRSIVAAEASAYELRINFRDDVCLDVAPYLVLGMIRQSMLPVCSGGQITYAVRKVLESMHLSELLNMRRVETEDSSVWPFALRIHVGGHGTHAFSPSYEEKNDQAFVNTLNTWLSQTGFSLSDQGEGYVATLIGEILDNARRHSDLVNHRGSWAMAGFMSRGAGERYLCHVAIFSLGASIYESLQQASPGPRLIIDSYVRHHGATGSRIQDLWTLAAVQDGVTRLPSAEGKGGIGMLELVEMANYLCPSGDDSCVAIVSGSSCVLIKAPYWKPVRQGSGHRILALNAANSLAQSPDSNHLLTLPIHIPGTIISVRFGLSGADLISRVRHD